jgi:peptidoglycan/xylan/chitin deacetylase (PgdA/CDA1 family)
MGSGTIQNMKILKNTSQPMDYSGSIQGTGELMNWSSYWSTLISATVETAAPTDVVLTFPAAQTSLVAADFTVIGFTVDSASWTGAALTLVLSENVTVFEGNLLVVFGKTSESHAVTNNIADDGNTLLFTDYETEASVSAWEDQTVNGNDLTQADAAKQPTIEADGVKFSGGTHFMQSGAIDDFVQPCSIYLVFKQDTWEEGKYIVDGINASITQIAQWHVANEIAFYAGSQWFVADSVNLGKYCIVTLTANGAASTIRINNHYEKIGSPGANGFDGLTIGARYVGDNGAKVTFKAKVGRKVADDSTVKQNIYNALKRRYFPAGAIDEGWGANKEVMIGFVCDDNVAEEYSVAYPLFEAYNVKGSFAIDTAAAVLTDAQLLEMQTAGHEIMSHTVSHLPLTGMAIEDAIIELENSKTVLQGKGLTINNFVYPGGNYNAAIATEVMSRYESGLTTDPYDQHLPLKLGRIRRRSVDAVSLADLKILVDNTIEDNGNQVLFFYGHPGTWDATKIQKVTDLLVYINGKGISVKTCKYIIDKIKTYDGIPTYTY